MHTTEWTEGKVVNGLVEEWQSILPITWQGRKYGPEEVWQAVLGATAQEQSLSQQSQTASGSPSAHHLLTILRAQTWWDLTTVERKLNVGLQRRVRLAGKGPLSLAIDLHQRPYYGREHPSVCGGEKKAGTHWFYTYATACVLRKKRRITVAVTMVWPGDTMEQVVARLLAYLDPMELWVREILLDRQFFAKDVIALLQDCQWPFIIPVRRTGDAQQRTGTQPLFEWETDGWTVWRLVRQDGKPVGFEVAIYVIRTDKGLKALPYAVNGLPHIAPKQVGKRYRGRGGIESTYREAYQARIPTTSTDPVYRLLCFGLALILSNAWWELRWELGERRPGRGGRHFPLRFLPFRQYLDWMASVIRQRWPLRPPETAFTQRRRIPKRRRLYRPVRCRAS